MPATLPKAIIDMHCHVFNATDLPAIKFINNVFRERYGQEPDGVMPGAGLLLEFVAGHAPRAGDELADFLGKKRPPSEFDTGGGDGLAATPFNPAHALRPDVAKNLLGWLHLFGWSRWDLAAKLASHYSSSGRNCVLMTPALVDYNAWLWNPDKKFQQLTDQVAVMGQMARQPGPCRIHGFVAFDPIRAILADVGRLPAGGGDAAPVFDPHKLVRDAVNKHGFLGVKLYPPMGFRAWHNDAADMKFPDNVKQDINSDGISDRDVGKLIDQQLAKLYKYCAKNGVPILAHAYNSNQSGQCFGWRASPQYWREVIKEFSTSEQPLRVCLAHFGRFDAHDVNKNCIAGPMLSDPWETIFGSILTEPGSEFVFADLSYFSEALDHSERGTALRAKLRDKIRKYLNKHDPDVKHLTYGSDWIMLGREQGNERYHEEIGTFLRDDVGLSSAQLARFFFGNAVRYLGLEPGEQNRERLEQFYRDNKIKDHFPAIDVGV